MPHWSKRNQCPPLSLASPRAVGSPPFCVNLILLGSGLWACLTCSAPLYIRGTVIPQTVWPNLAPLGVAPVPVRLNPAQANNTEKLLPSNLPAFRHARSHLLLQAYCPYGDLERIFLVMACNTAACQTQVSKRYFMCVSFFWYSGVFIIQTHMP